MIRELTTALVIILSSGTLSACSCEEKSETKHDSGTGAPDASDVDADTDTDSDTDTDTDTDTDSDTDTDTDPVDPEIDWVEVPAGSFTFGSPVGTPCRGPSTEKEVPVTLTHPFLMSKYEVTQKQWDALGLLVPPITPPCDNCPVSFINWFEAMAWCNALSQFEGLEECYDLSSCSGEVGSTCWPEEPDCPADVDLSYECSAPVRKFESMYDCQGYRLPTGPEWEYAAKAGTTTNTYNGDITVDSDGICINEPILNDIAWYCYNSGYMNGSEPWSIDSLELLREIGLNQPNPFGLYDMLGNAWEWVDYVSSGGGIDWAYGGTGELITNPVGPNETIGDMRDIRGGGYTRVSCRVRAAYQFPDLKYNRGPGYGFRPVRTLPSTTPDAGPGDSGVK